MRILKEPYNSTMKIFRLHSQYFCLALALMLSALFSSSSNSWAQSDPALEKQKADCGKSASSEWSPTLHKCVGKVEARQARHEANDCNAIAEMSQREACHKALAEKKTGLSSDPKSLNQGNTTGSMIMNAAYSIVALINHTGTSGKKSSCTSKTIFGVTAVAGLASDFYLKYKAKKKVEELAGKYKLDTKNGASDAQVKALEYLKEEQNTVAEIASMEKKRNMLLMLGYGAAGVMAAVELAWPAMSPACAQGDPKSAGEKAKPPVEQPIDNSIQDSTATQAISETSA